MTENLILMWKYPANPHCIDTFQIYFSEDFVKFQHITDTQSVNNFHFLPFGKKGWYQIRVKGFDGNLGPPSVPYYWSTSEF